MGKNPGFRAWFYFRQGWSTYFAFIFAAINTLTVTYYLAIENYPFLKTIFPSFEQYILIVVLVGIPLLGPLFEKKNQNGSLARFPSFIAFKPKPPHNQIVFYQSRLAIP